MSEQNTTPFYKALESLGLKSTIMSKCFQNEYEHTKRPWQAWLKNVVYEADKILALRCSRQKQEIMSAIFSLIFACSVISQGFGWSLARNGQHDQFNSCCWST